MWVNASKVSKPDLQVLLQMRHHQAILGHSAYHGYLWNSAQAPCLTGYLVGHGRDDAGIDIAPVISFVDQRDGLALGKYGTLVVNEERFAWRA